MPTILKRRNADSSISFLAQVRIAGFDAVSKCFPAKRDAEQWATELEQRLREQKKRGGVRRDVGVLTVSDIILEFLKDPETTALRSFDELHRLCAWWVLHHGGTRALELNVVTLRDAREKISKGRGPATTNRYLSAMRSCWNWARSAGLVPRDHLWPERLMLTEPKGRTRFLADDELATLLKASREHSALMYALTVVSIATGVRQGELLRLDWADIDMEKQTLRIRITKNDEPRTVFLPEPAIAGLRKLKDGKVRAIGPVFIIDDGTRLKKSTLEARWKLVRTAAGLSDFRWHDLRHSCASFLAQQGATLMQIGAQLGHKSPAVTQRYSHLVQGAALPAHAVFDTKLGG